MSDEVIAWSARRCAGTQETSSACAQQSTTLPSSNVEFIVHQIFVENAGVPAQPKWAGGHAGCRHAASTTTCHVIMPADQIQALLEPSPPSSSCMKNTAGPVSARCADEKKVERPRAQGRQHGRLLRRKSRPQL